MAAAPQLPYGIADYTAIRAERMAYVDKTQFIPELERAGHFLFYHRPRRFGKSLMVSLLYSYYDLLFTDQFEALFGDTWIGKHPTNERNSYMVLHFNFAEVDPDPVRVRESFETYTETIFLDLIRRYPNEIDEQAANRIASVATAGDRLSALFTYAAGKGLKVYVLIDEYDNFTNTILSTRDGETAYRALTHEAGFFRHFFNVLKGGTQKPNSGLARLFVTGVSPVTMDDVTSGYNIGRQVSLRPQLSEMTGFTRSEVKQLVAAVKVPETLKTDMESVLDLLDSWYGGYRFNTEINESVFNPDMVLYFLDEVNATGKLPADMIDHNVRIDYSKLRGLVTVDNRLNGNFSRLKQVLEEGSLISRLKTGFPYERVADEENFVSLLLYFGLVAPRGEERGQPKLVIPNRTIETLMYGYMRNAFDDVGVFQTRMSVLEKALSDMAWVGEWRPFFERLAESVAAQTSIRDYLSSEKVIQGFLLAYLNVADFFLPHSERELNKGFCDLYLEPFLSKYPGLGYGYLVELKFIKRGNLTETVQRNLTIEAEDQLKRYLADKRLAQLGGKVKWVGVFLIFHGWELIAADSVG